jgi:nucleoside-diphosphate-sugar epimerase
MRVLVTGASGFVGRHLISKLLNEDIEHIILGRNTPDDRKNIRADLLSCSDLQVKIQKFKPTHLIHLAWYAEHGKYWESPLNIDWMIATQRLIESFCNSGGKHVVVAGTCAEYDWGYGYCVEDLTPLAPRTLYGIAKKSTFDLVSHLCAKYQVKLSWARIFFPYGAGEAKERLIPSLFDVFRAEKPPFGVNKGAYRDLLHVSDVAEAICLCSKSSVHGAINISSGCPVLLEHVVQLVASRYGKSPSSVLSLKSSRVGEPVILVGDNRKLKALGWRQQISLSEGIQAY